MILRRPSEVLKAEPKVDETTVVKGVGAEDRRAGGGSTNQPSSKVEVNSRRVIDGGAKRKSGRNKEGREGGRGGSNPRLQTSHHREV